MPSRIWYVQVKAYGSQVGSQRELIVGLHAWEHDWRCHTKVSGDRWDIPHECTKEWQCNDCWSTYVVLTHVPQGWFLGWAWPILCSNWLLQHWFAGALASCHPGSCWAQCKRQPFAGHVEQAHCDCPIAVPETLYRTNTLAAN